MHFLLSLDLWIKVYCVLLVVVFLYFVLRAWRSAKVVKTAAHALEVMLEEAVSITDEERQCGRSLELVDALRTRSQNLSDLSKQWWRKLDSALAPYGLESRGKGWYLTAPAAELLDEELVIHQRYDSAFYGGVPGLLTSLGLLGTFVAILIGLSSLRREGNMIQGVPELVGSLSGKFATSVTALGLSAIYTVIEGLAFQAPMRTARERLIGAVHNALPRLSISRLLVDLQIESAKQTRSLANISSDLVDKVAGLFAAEFRDNVAPNFAAGVSSQMASSLSKDLVPALDRVTLTMDHVGAAVQRLETGKQESVVGELRGLTEAIERSITSSLAEMGAQFREALKGSTKDEFSGLAKTLQDSAGVVSQMNGSFSTLQSSLAALIEESRSTTSAQMANSVERTEQLNQLVEGLLIRLNDSATQNASHISGVLTHVVTELSDKVNMLSKELTTQVAAASAQTQAVAAESLRAAGDWSARSDQKLIDLLGVLEGRVADFDRASASLMSVQKVLEGSLAQSANGLTAMKDAAGQVKTYSLALSGLQAKVTDGQHAQTELATMTRRAIEQLTAMSGHHSELLANYNETFIRAEQVFGGLDERLRRVLETILEKVQQYNIGVERNFQAVVHHMNTTMPQMGEVLAGAAVELRDQVDELTEVLSAGTNRLRA